jgi:hypothetical protein
MTRSTRGPCASLRWDEALALYRCGLLDAGPETHESRFAAMLGSTWQAVARRWIGAGLGCDCSLEVDAVVPPTTPGTSDSR